MDNYFFAFGPNDSYLYNSPDGWGRNRLPSAIEDLFLNDRISDVLWASFSPDPANESWFLSYIEKGGDVKMLLGDGIPTALKNWLYSSKRKKLRRDKHVRVSLGPNASFFAWDSKSMRWDCLPETLEETIQDWLSPSGWKVGPPRIVTLGCEDSWFALSEYGKAAWYIPDQFESLQETWNEWQAEGFDRVDFAFVAFDPCADGQFVAIRADSEWQGCIDDSNASALQAFADGMINPSRKSGRDQSSKSQNNGYIPPDPRTLDMARYYTAWHLQYTSLFDKAAEIPLTAFPHPPAVVLICKSISCIPIKADVSGLRACRHDIESLLRGSGKYSYEWLRRERLIWHPDRFIRLCAAEFREEGRRKAEELYKIFEELMREEKERLGEAS